MLTHTSHKWVLLTLSFLLISVGFGSRSIQPMGIADQLVRMKSILN
jgi:hypothetical protein